MRLSWETRGFDTKEQLDEHIRKVVWGFAGANADYTSDVRVKGIAVRDAERVVGWLWSADVEVSIA